MGTQAKVYERTEDGTVTYVSIREAMAEVNHAMMGGQREVQEMSSGRDRHSIDYKDGRSVLLVLVDAPAEDVKEWAGTASNGAHMHRFGDDHRARCNSRIFPKTWVGKGVILKTREEIEAGEYAHLYTFCLRCEAK